MFFSKEMNRLISKGMSNIYYWEKLTFSKLVGKVNFSERRFEEMHYLWRAKSTRYLRGNFYFGIIALICLSSTKPYLRFLLICFALEIKGFYQSSWGNEFDVRNIMNVSPDNLAKNQNLKKLIPVLLMKEHW